MSYYDIPERPIDPPEYKERVAFSCAICGEDVYAGEDYYDIPELGCCCEDCIFDARRYDAEAPEDDGPDPDEAYDRMREEELFNE